MTKDQVAFLDSTGREREREREDASDIGVMQGGSGGGGGGGVAAQYTFPSVFSVKMEVMPIAI
jgi:hypothetical protein